MHHAPATCVAVAATAAAAATTVTTTAAAAAAAAAATAEADSSAVPERERIHTGCCRCFSCGGSTALLGQLEQLFDCCCHARAGTSSCFASCRITKNYDFYGSWKTGKCRFSPRRQERKDKQQDTHLAKHLLARMAKTNQIGSTAAYL